MHGRAGARRDGVVALAVIGPGDDLALLDGHHRRRVAGVGDRHRRVGRRCGRERERGERAEDARRAWSDQPAWGRHRAGDRARGHCGRL